MKKYKQAVRILESDCPPMLTRKDAFKAVMVFEAMAKIGFKWNEVANKWVYAGTWSKRK